MKQKIVTVTTGFKSSNDCQVEFETNFFDYIRIHVGNNFFLCHFHEFANINGMHIGITLRKVYDFCAF